MSEHGRAEQPPVTHRRSRSQPLAETGQEHQPGGTEQCDSSPRTQPPRPRDRGGEHRFGVEALFLRAQPAGRDDRIDGHDDGEIERHVSEVAVYYARPPAHESENLLGHPGRALVHGAGERTEDPAHHEQTQ